MLEEKDRTKLDTILERHRSEPGPLISILQDVQNTFGYLPENILTYLSHVLKIPESRMWGTVTFYSQFYLQPRGENTIKVCMGTACHVRGAAKILERLQRILGIKAGETTEDLKFNLETVRCLGTCFLAPVIMINSDYFGKLTPEKVEKILERY